MLSIKELISGAAGFVAAGFVRTVLLNQCGFDLKRAVFQAGKAETPAFDARILAAMGDAGLPQPVKLDADELAMGMAAGFVLTTRHMGKADPNTGRKPEYLAKMLKSPKEVIEQGVDWRLQQEKARTEATAKAINADPTKRLAAIDAEAEAQKAALVEPHLAYFARCLADCVKADDDALVDIACEAMVNAGRDPTKEVQRAAQAFLDAQKKRFEEGKFTAVDAGIYALAQG